MAEEESANDPQFMGLVYMGWDIAVFVIKPIGIAITSIVYYAAFSTVFVLRLLWRPIEFILLPLLYLGDFILRCFLAPFRFLAKFETLYIYLGVAALVGLAGGTIISLISGGLQGLLGLNRSNSPPAARQGRTVSQWRKSKRSKEESNGDVQPASSALEVLKSPLSGNKKGKRKSKASHFGQQPTILEELDSDY